MAKNGLFFLVFMNFIFHSFGQEVPKIEKTFYKSPDGKLYVNKSLPIYLFIGTDSTNKQNAYLLHSQSTSQYVNPMYFDAEGLNTIRSPWCVDTSSHQLVYPKREIIFEVYADSKPPHSQIKFDNAKIKTKRSKYYINGKAVISFSAIDELAGVAKIMYSIDNEPYKEYNTPISLENEKEYVIQYFSYDNVGNIEDVKKIILVVDKSKPTAEYKIEGNYFENIVAADAKFLINAADSISELENIIFQIDDDKELTYKQPINIGSLLQGEHKITFYATDFVENESEKKTFEFYVDKTPPTILPEIIGKTYMINGKEFSSGRSQLKLTTIDNKAGIKEIYYSINNGEFKKYEKPVLLSAVTGKMTIKIYALDNVNNKSEVYESAETSSLPYIDLAGPEISFRIESPYIINKDTFIISKKTRISLMANDSEAGVKEILYSIDKSDHQPYSQPFSISEDGVHIIDITALDNVDNTNNDKLIVFTDNKGPEIYTLFTTSPRDFIVRDNSKIPVYPSFVGLFVSATDPYSGYDKMFYSINGSPEKQFSGYISNFKGDTKITITCYDRLGNTSKTQIEFVVKD